MPFFCFPYLFGGAGDINSTVEDAARWVRLQLANGTFEGRRIVSQGNLAVTRTARVAMSDKMFYANGWIVMQTPNGNIVWHSGGTASFGAMIAMSLDKDVGVIVLTVAILTVGPVPPGPTKRCPEPVIWLRSRART